MADSLSADSAFTLANRKKVRERARYEVLNSPIARGIVQTHTSSIVGTGPRLQAITKDQELNRQIERGWRRWARERGLTEKLRLLISSKTVDGESFGIMVTGERFEEVTLDFRVFECDQCTTPDLVLTRPGYIDGIEFNTSTGRPYRYHVLREHPGDMNSRFTREYDCVWAHSIIHLFRELRPGQHRGLSELTPSLDLFAVIRRYISATLAAAEHAASYSFFMKTPALPQDMTSYAWQEMEIQHGAGVFLPDGYEPFQLKSENPSTAFDSFRKAIIATIARCLEMPYNLAACDSAGYNYSSGKLDHQIYGKRVAEEQDYLERVCLDRLFSMWLEESVLCGALPVQAVLAAAAHEWQWDPLEDIDPKSTIEANSSSIESGVKSSVTVMGEMGLDWRSEQAKEAEFLGMTVAAYQAALRAKRFTGIDLAAVPAVESSEVDATAEDPGEFADMSTLQVRRNKKQINETLDQVRDGLITDVRALEELQMYGVRKSRAQILIDDAHAGKLDDVAPTVSPLAAALRLKGAVYHQYKLLNASGNGSKPSALLMSGTAELKAEAGQSGSGRIDILAYNGGPLPVDGFAFPVIVDLKGLEIPSQVRPVCIDHDTTYEGVLGQTDVITVNPATGQIHATGQATGVSQKAKAVREMSAHGHKWQASIGALVGQQDIVPAGQTVEVNGQRFLGPLIIARTATLREISFVANGADTSTLAQIAAAAAEGSKMPPTFEEWVASLGLDPATLSEVQKTELTKLYTAQAAPPPAPPAAPPAAPPVDAMAPPAPKPDEVAAAALKGFRATMAAETDRIARIQIIAKDHPTLQASAIRENWSAEKIELEVLKAERPKAPAGYSHTNDAAPRVLEAAMCRAAGVKAIEKQFTDQELSAVDRYYRSGLGIKGLLMEAAAKCGVSCNPRDFNANHRRILTAAFSTADVSGIVSNVQNKKLLEGWESVEDAWQEVCTTDPVPDYKPQKSYRLTSGGTFAKVGDTGELRHGSLGEDAYENEADIWGELITINRKMQVNDDMQALTAIPKMLGRKAGLTLNLEFWTTFLEAHATLFTSEHNNYFEGASTNLQISSLTTAVTKFGKQVGSDNNPLGIPPAKLLVPVELGVIADEIFASLTLNTGGSSTKDQVPNKNTHSGKYKPVKSAYLSNATLFPLLYSLTRWWLFADPADLAAMNVVFLDGNQTPTIETADAEFGTLGIQSRAVFSFGVGTQAYQAAVESKGAA